jgi:predicted RNase H-like nuclease (RuvC/YqgF family)
MPTQGEIKRMMSDDIPESVKEGVNLGLYTLDEALELYHTGKCSSNTDDQDTPLPTSTKRKSQMLQALQVKKLKSQVRSLKILVEQLTQENTTIKAEKDSQVRKLEMEVAYWIDVNASITDNDQEK